MGRDGYEKPPKTQERGGRLVSKKGGAIWLFKKKSKSENGLVTVGSFEKKRKDRKKTKPEGGGALLFLRGCVVFLFILFESEKRKKRVEEGMVFGEVLLGHLGAVCSLRSMEVLLGL